ncbi:MAG: amino acid adenylation domain-containing protein [Gammaproteobacteria bacterium]
MFVLQNAPRPVPKVSRIGFDRIDIDSETTQFDLSLFLRERDGKLIGFFEYSTDLFDRETIERMVDHFQTLLEGIVADPDQIISTLPLSTEAERHQLLVEWNNTKAEYPKDACIHELFEAQAARTPDAVVVEFEGKQLTYRELNGRANQLAHYLRYLGVGPEKLVGICIDRSLEMLIGVLGILKAGGGYVPLDPTYPRERVVFMMEDSQVSVLLTQENLLAKIQHPAPSTQYSELNPKILCLDRDWEDVAQQSGENLHANADSTNVAYVIYTSGSTGAPKGVAIEHRSPVALLNWAKNVFTAGELAGVLASTSICFDLSIFEIFVPLSWGGKVILAENALCLHSLNAKDEVTFINTVPSVMVELLRAGKLPDSVRTVNLAGEPLLPELVREVYNGGKVEKVYDLYGPSETTTYSTFALRTCDGPETVGRPIANTRTYILDGNLQPVPVGVRGELYIGGAGVGRGYRYRPELTSERFIPNPYSSEPGARLYRTGDLARYRPDGTIEFLGRIDNQVKVRGYRIELGEIESALNQHPGVRESVVVARECVIEEQHESDNLKSKTCTGDSRLKSDKTLIAYVVSQKQQPTVIELRHYLKEKLPEYMVPSAFLVLDELLLLPNGKLDRRKLPPPDDAGPQLAEPFVEPRSQVEELIAQTWREVLKIENIGVHESFFELGGHSLLAVQIVARLRDTFNREIPLRVLFEAPTIPELSIKIGGLIREGYSPELPPVVPVPRDRPLPLSFNQEHLWYLDQMIPGTHFFNMPYVYRLTGEPKIDALEKAIAEIIRRHEALRTVFGKVDGRPVQIITSVPEFQLPVLDLRGFESGELEHRAAQAVLEERERPFDLVRGPLIRTKLLQLADTEHLLLITMHHIIGDYWSMQIFRRELLMLYETLSQGGVSPLSDLPIHFGDYAVWERTTLESGLLDSQVEYWKRQLSGPLRHLEFREYENSKRERRYETSHQLIEPDESLCANIRALSRQENCTLFMAVISALGILLHLYSGQPDIRIGTLVENRARRSTEDTVGHYLNTVILCFHIEPYMTFQQVLRQVRNIILAAKANQELPFEHLARVLEREHNLDRSSISQVLVNYQHYHLDSMQTCGLTIASLDLQSPTIDTGVTLTGYDLIFNLRESSTKFTGTVNYKIESFEPKAMSKVINSFHSILGIMRSQLTNRISILGKDFSGVRG